MAQFLIGVDEAGRAPLAGPVSVGAVMVPLGFDVQKEFPGVRDSKKLSPKKREALYKDIMRRARTGEVRFCARFSSHSCIDRFGITQAVRRAVWSAVHHLAPEPDTAHVLLDGLLRAPHAYTQETIIRGDDIIPLISLASIVAKVTRDRRMCCLAKKFPAYGFEIHKGYPTDAHYAAIERSGLCVIHRRSFKTSRASS